MQWNRLENPLEQITAQKLMPYRDIVPFIDLAPSFILFIRRLHEQIAIAKPEQLLFLSREGKILKQLFDIYAEVNGCNQEVKTHYFQVSRRSTWLMSLPNCKSDSFNEYFRQYFRSSLADLIKSLTLDDYFNIFADELGIRSDEMNFVYDNLQQQFIYKRLLDLSYFQKIFKLEQDKRRKFFDLYLQNIIGNNIPNKIHVVDVGWKGSIQDNLFRFLDQQNKNVEFYGYYLGLNQSGFQHPNNHKQAIIFSCVNRQKTTGFELFNECKALYELYLPAGHGAALKYQIAEDNKTVSVVYDDYKDGKMIEQKILPFTYQFIEYFEILVKEFQNIQYSDEELYQLAFWHHARVVFAPKKFERDWINTVYHSENFGVFHFSLLNNQSNKVGIFGRIKFTINVIRKKSISRLGYWPYLTLNNNAFYGLSLLYKHIRLWQAKRNRNFLHNNESNIAKGA